ncbi:hypothetical protein [Sphingomonas changbaiensis]|uniref:hypothetical protein n=1 Tax=Sphingomonas changbaiensis TaxID=529705 RepID=UPI000A67305E|nr:hypothetical protein [Sphingomonas changbaiensis]
MRGVLAAVAAAYVASAPASAGLKTSTRDLLGRFLRLHLNLFKASGDLVITNGDISGGQVNGSIIEFGCPHPYFTTL